VARKLTMMRAARPSALTAQLGDCVVEDTGCHAVTKACVFLRASSATRCPSY